VFSKLDSQLQQDLLEFEQPSSHPSLQPSNQESSKDKDSKISFNISSDKSAQKEGNSNTLKNLEDLCLLPPERATTIGSASHQHGHSTGDASNHPGGGAGEEVKEARGQWKKDRIIVNQEK